MNGFVTKEKRSLTVGRMSVRKALAVFMVLAIVISNLSTLTAVGACGQEEIAIIDSKVIDAQVLLEGIRPGVEVIRIDSGKDGISQIAEALAERHDIDAIHIISHGEPGRIFLGNGVLTSQNLEKYKQQFASIGKALKKNGAILLYGCNIASGIKGTAFINKLAEYTHAQLSASANPTGSKAKGGDWILEYKTGKVNTPNLFGNEVQNSYHGLLGDIVLSVESANVNAGGLGPGLGAELVSGEANSISSTPGVKIYFTDKGTDLQAGVVSLFNMADPSQGGYAVSKGIFHAKDSDATTNYADFSSTYTKYMVIEKTDGSMFNFKQAKICFAGKVTISIEGFRGTTSTGTSEYTYSDENVKDIYLSEYLIPSIFQNVDKVTITGKEYPEDISLTDVLDTSRVNLSSVTLGDPATHLTYEVGTFTESAANNGMITTTKVVTLEGDTFVAGPFTEGVHYTTANVPLGMTLTVTRDSSTQVTLSLTGTAAAHTNANDAANLTISFQNAAYTGNNAAVVTNSTKNDMAIDFADAPLLTYAAGAFTESAANDGTISITKAVTLTGDTFVAGTFTEGNHYTVANVPTGMTLAVARNSEAQVTLSLTGTAAVHNVTNNISNLTISFQNAAFTNVEAARITGTTKSDMAVHFNNPSLSYAAGTFTEAAANIGTIIVTKVVTLAGDTFVVGPFIENTHYTSANVPVGMTLTVTRDNDTQILVNLTGTATAHENANDAVNLTISFKNAAFTGNNTAVVTNSTKNDMAIDFADAPVLTYAAGTFTETAANDGTITATKVVTFTGDTFAAGPFANDTHYTAANVPAGMTLTVARNSDTQVTLSLTGTAAAHNNANDISNLMIAFKDTAFTHVAAVGVIGSTKSDMAVDFNNPALSYAAGTFTEATLNIGTIAVTKAVILSGDAFAAGTFIAGTHYTATNVPTGMTLIVTRDSNTQIILSLTGTAAVHENANDTADLTISFKNAAFVGNNAAVVANSTKNDMVIDFADAPVLTYAAGTFTESAANDGTIEITKAVTLTGDIFAAGLFAEGTHYTAVHVPTGMTLIVTRDSGTQVTLSFTGTAAAHNDSNDISNLTISFQNAAFTNVAAAGVIGFTKNDMTVDFNNPSLSYAAGVFTEAAANIGTITVTKAVTLSGDMFAAGPFTGGTHYTAANVPSGMMLTVARDSHTQVTLSLVGTAAAHENANDAVNLTISFKNAAFAGNNAAVVVNVTKNDMTIDFTDAPVLTYAAGAFTETAANDGTISTTKAVTLIGDTFAAGVFTEGTHYTAAHVPTGMTLTVTRNSGTQVTLSLTGTAAAHNNTNDVSDLTISFKDAAFTNVAVAGVIGSTKSNMAVDFNNPALSYAAGTFTEAAANDGTIPTTKAVTLIGDTFTAGPFTEGTHYTAANVPTGMMLKVLRDSGTQVTLSLTGTAAAHENANDAADLTITFKDAAFAGNNAGVVANATKNDMETDFADAPVLIYAAGIFTESAANDGTITVTKAVTLSGDIFATGSFITGTHYTAANIPAGMTLAVVRNNDTQLTLSLTGTAAAHNNANDISSLTVSFQNAAFANALAAGVTGFTKNDMVLDFNDPSLTYASGVFAEETANIGTITATKAVTLSGDTFAAGSLTEGTHYTAVNVPSGMTLKVTRDSGTQVMLSLTGTAAAHEDANDTAELTISFKNAAFTGNNAAVVANATKNDMVIDFADAPVLTYAAGVFTELAANDGTIAITKTVTLTGDTFAAGPFTEGTYYTASNVPMGMTLKVTWNSDTQVTLSLTGIAAAHNNANSISNLTISFKDAAFANAVATGVKESTKNDMVLDFNDPSLTYAAGVFAEETANIGTITATKAVTLSGDTFAAGSFTEGTHYMAANVPSGMTLKVTRDSGTQVTLSLTGTAAAHEDANDTAELTISFKNPAFAGNNAAVVANATKNDMVIDFADAPILTYAAGAFIELAANDGTIAITKTVTLTGDTFAAGAFTEGTHYTTVNVPEGMTLKVARNSGSRVTISLTGTAAVHNDASDISNLTISFKDAAFANAFAAGVKGSTKNDMAVCFMDPPSAGNNGIITAGKVTANTIELTWTAGTDNETIPANLKYKVLYSTSNNIGTPENAILNGTVVKEWTANLTSQTAIGLTAETTNYFNVIIMDEAGNMTAYTTLSKATAVKPNDNVHSDEGDGTNTAAPTPTPPAAASTTEVIVNGQVHNAGTTTTTKVKNQTVTTVIVDDKKIEDKLNASGNNTTVVIPVNNTSDVVIGQLNGQTVKNMETKEAVLEIKTENVSYTLPASEINIDSISAQIGKQVALKDIKVSVRIAASQADTVHIVQDTANKNNYGIVVKPLEFEITCSSGNKTIEISKFNGYVERTVAIPDGVDPSKITTGIVLNKDGTFSHVPTSIIFINGKYYAKISSLTNSTYSVIWNPKTFNDVEKHWAEIDVNDMGSRLVIEGNENGSFEPDREITRGEFAAVVVRGLGLMRTGTGKDIYKDVKKNDWYYDAVYIAYEYGLIYGMDNGKYEPNRKITRQEAMSIITRAMSIAKMNTKLDEAEIAKALAGYGDSGSVSSWAKKSVAVCISNEIVLGSNGNIKANDNITRAETAAVMRRLLKKCKLI